MQRRGFVKVGLLHCLLADSQNGGGAMEQNKERAKTQHDKQHEKKLRQRTNQNSVGAN